MAWIVLRIEIMGIIFDYFGGLDYFGVLGNA
jgi:hypothetical protein